ncbi:MAG: hypothetical protein EOM64_02565 [Erysipelotrichia bacterium]|nr:hypothetical protein [Erysipelotrichia bacterium]
MNNQISGMIFAIAIVIGVLLTIKYLWPVILVIGLLIGFGIWRARHIMHEAEKEARKSMGENINGQQDVPQYEQDLFQSQVKEAQNRQLRTQGDIIDAEFIRKDEQKEEEGQEKH